MNDIDASIKSFDNDPPDSPYQEGYRAAMIEARRVGQLIIVRERVDAKILEILKNRPSLYSELIGEAEVALTAPRT